jgi:hypothetical protein
VEENYRDMTISRSCSRTHYVNRWNDDSKRRNLECLPAPAPLHLEEGPWGGALGFATAEHKSLSVPVATVRHDFGIYGSAPAGGSM